MDINGIIAKQPIFYKDKSVYGYELLFRNSEQNLALVSDDTQATSTVLINTLNTFGLSSLTQGRYALVNIGQNLLMDSALEIIPKEHFVLEILEDVIVNKELIKRVEHLKELGYILAIDDFNFDSKMLKNFEPLLEMVDIIKFDIAQIGHKNLKQKLKPLKRKNLKFLAEKVETYEEFEACKSLGFDYFQGYFFTKPLILQKRRLDPSKAVVLHLISILQNKESSIKEIELEFAKSLNLTINLLKYLNSAHISLKHQINSISHAIALLGCSELIRWLTLYLYANNANNIFTKTLLEQSLFKAKFMSELALSLNYKKEFQEKAYLTGMISSVDTLFSISFDEIFKEIDFEDDIRFAILQKTKNLGKLLMISDLAYKGDKKIFPIFKKLGVSNLRLQEITNLSHEWAAQNSN